MKQDISTTVRLNDGHCPKCGAFHDLTQACTLPTEPLPMTPSPENSMNWNQYKRKGLSEMRPYVVGEDVLHVSISEPDKQNGSPKEGDMIARNPKNHADQWLVAKKYFEDNLEPA